MHQIHRRLLLTCASALVLATAVRGDDEAFRYDVPSTNIAVTDPILIQGFDPSLGQLEDVTVKLTLTTSSQPTIINFTATPQGFTGAFTGFTTTLTGPDLSTLSLTTTTPGVAGTVSPGVTTLTPAYITTPSGTLSVPTAGFGAYESSSDIALSLDAPNQTSGGTATMDNSGNVLFGGKNSYSGSVSVDYTYLAVPEPASLFYLPLIGMAFVLIRCRNVRV